PRFLHSTGQLHKGDRGRGLFVQLTHAPAADVPIRDAAGSPAPALTFGVLELAQALGDGQALREAGRRVVRLDLGGDVMGGLARLSDGLGR
ncbi:MAG: glucose-6-phosphate isomerase, partial [Chloroflexi bacterium CFX6]|nr:glucose-6-phosphate isomerase [Chloroflexi bacterium CFX6]